MTRHMLPDLGCAVSQAVACRVAEGLTDGSGLHGGSLEDGAAQQRDEARRSPVNFGASQLLPVLGGPEWEERVSTICLTCHK